LDVGEFGNRNLEGRDVATGYPNEELDVVREFTFLGRLDFNGS